MKWFRRRTRQAAEAQSDSQSGRRFELIGGRRHVANMPYVLPKDDAEISRLDFQHFMLRYVLHGNYLAPINQPRAVLDVGCGSGRWAMEMATYYPQANVVGVDLVPPPADSQPQQGYGLDRRPENYVFVEGNVMNGLPFADQSFDFVHMSLLSAAIPSARWQDVVAEMVRVTRIGGWIEMLEGNPFPHAGNAAAAITGWIMTATTRKGGIDPYVYRRLEPLLQQARLDHIVLRDLPIPIGKYGGRLGGMMETDTLALIKTLQPAVIGMGITDAASFDRALAAWPAEIAQLKTTVPFADAYGQRLA